VKVAGQTLNWLRLVSALTVGGMATAAAVGAAVGKVGAIVIPPTYAQEAGYFVLIAALLGGAHDLGFSRIRLPQPRRQTAEWWGKRHRALAAALWGADLGLIFSTWFTFSGPVVISAVVLAHRNAITGAIFIGSYWVGRALTVWYSPMLFADANATLGVLHWVHERRKWFACAQVTGIAFATALTLIQVLGETAP
jgi:hypothetical protein